MGAAKLPFRAARALVGCVSLVSAACTATTQRSPIGVSTAVPEAEAPALAKAPVARTPWPDFAAARTWPEAGPPVTALAHRRDGTRIHVRVEPSGLDAYRALATDAPMPEGARVAAFHETPAGQLLGSYVLEKRSGVWRATELDAQGLQLPNDGVACLRCHDLAPTDHLFGLTARSPVPPPPAEPGGSGN